MSICTFQSPVYFATLNGNYLYIILLSIFIIFSFRYNIDTHDYDVRLRAAKKFLKDGDKVGSCYVIFCSFCILMSDFYLSK